MKVDTTDPAVAAAELPAEVESLIVKVVRRTRLRKAERADIERELAAHFRDGLASGKSVAQLMEAFGEAKVSAKSIRAGAIAKRSPLDQALRQIRIVAGWGCVALLVFYATSIGYLWAQAPVIRFDPIDQLRDMLPKVAAQDRAWPVYKRGLIASADSADQAYPPASPNAWHPYRPNFDTLGELLREALPNSPEWPDLREALRARRTGIDTIAQAASMPTMGYMPSFAPNRDDADLFNIPNGPAKVVDTKDIPIFHIAMPHLGPLRIASQLLAADSLLAVEEGQGDRFVRDIEAMIRLSHQVEELQFMITQSQANAIRSTAFDRIRIALEWQPGSLSDKNLKRLAELLRDIPARDYELDLSVERLMIHDLVQRIYSDDGSGDGWLNPNYAKTLLEELEAFGEKDDPSWSEWKLMRRQFERDHPAAESMMTAFLSPTSAFIAPTRKEMIDCTDSMMKRTEEQSKRPLWLWDFWVENSFLFRNDVSALTKTKWSLMRRWMPAITHFAQARKMGESQCAAAQTAVAMTQYRRDHGGEWPSSIGQLVPDYLDDLPLDPRTGRLVDYEMLDGRPYVYIPSWKSRAARQDGKPFDPHWKNGPYGDLELDWLWFRGDDKLERWNSAE